MAGSVGDRRSQSRSARLEPLVRTHAVEEFHELLSFEFDHLSNLSQTPGSERAIVSAA